MSDAGEHRSDGRVSALHDSFADRVVEAEVRARLFGAGDAPVQLGRFRVIRALGSGAMGTVWLARDDELDREVAVKLLRPGLADDPASRSRLLREARTLAKLSDPHIVVVHEVGQATRGVWVAMELVRGATLRAWCGERPRRTAEVLAVLVQAGHGLAAAHRLGVVHRDFKPDNVLVAEDGRAKVVDFGLARAGVDDERLVSQQDTSAAVVEHDPLALTQTGALLGTPAYMAPEQLAGAAATAKSDQFAFCVALHEALTGSRPFPGTNVGELRAAMQHGRRVPVVLPRRIRAAIDRGLRREPDERWADMDALLAALAPRRRPVVVALAAVSIAAMATLGWIGRKPACDDAGERWAAAWTDEVRSRVETAVLASDRPYAPAVWASTSVVLDGYHGALQASARAACLAARPDLADAATSCLASAHTELASLVADLEGASPRAIASAPHRASALPDVHGCSDARRLALAPVPDTDATARLAEAHTALATARDRHAAIAYEAGGPELAQALTDGQDAATRAVELADAIAAGPLGAAARLVRSRFLLRRGDAVAAERDLQRALELANAADDPVLRVHALVQRVYVVGLDGDRVDEAHALGAEAEALIDATGMPPLLRAQLDNHLGTVAARDRRRDPDRALAHHRAALAAFRELLGDGHPDTIASRTNLGSALAQAGQLAEARAELVAVLEPARATWGDDHPHVGRLHGVLGNTMLRAGELEQAETWMRGALAIQERALGPDDPEVANALYNLAMVLERRGRGAEAADALRRGLAIRERVVGPAAAELIVWLVALGDAELAAQRPADAETDLRRALALCETDGAPPQDFARVRLALARALVGRDRDEARVLATHARDAYRSLARPEQVAEAERVLAELAG